MLTGLDAPEREAAFDEPTFFFFFPFYDVSETPLLSINRDFSAPALIEAERRAGELEKLAKVDSDPFARFEAFQQLMFHAMLAAARGEPIDPHRYRGDPRATLHVERARRRRSRAKH